MAWMETCSSENNGEENNMKLYKGRNKGAMAETKVQWQRQKCNGRDENVQ